MIPISPYDPELDGPQPHDGTRDDEQWEEKLQPQPTSFSSAGTSKSGDSSKDDLDILERASTHGSHYEYEAAEEETRGGSLEKQRTLTRFTSRELKKTASNALSKIGSRMTTHSLPPPPPPPDGGIAAWTTVFCGWLVIITTWGYVNSFGAFQSYYTTTLPQSPSTISWIGSIQVFLTFFIGAFSGRLLDAGWFRPTFLAGAILQLLGIFMTSLSTKYWHLMLTQGIMTGLGSGLFFTPSMGLIATYFQKRRGMAIGMSSTGNSIGGIIYPLMVRQLLPKVGFAWTTRVLGFVNLACLTFVFFFMKPRLPPRSTGPIVDWKAFTEPIFVSFTAGFFVVLWGFYFTFYYLASFGNDVLGMTYSESAILVIIVNGVGFPFRIIPGIIADRTGPLNIVIPAVAMVTVVSYSWLGVSTRAGFYAFTVFYGISTAAFQCLMPTSLASITKELNKVGTRLGMLFSSVSFAALTGPPIGGAIQAATAGHGYKGAQAWAGTCAALCFGLFLTTRVLKAGWKINVRC